MFSSTCWPERWKCSWLPVTSCTNTFQLHCGPVKRSERLTVRRLLHANSCAIALSTMMVDAYTVEPTRWNLVGKLSCRSNRASSRYFPSGTATTPSKQYWLNFEEIWPLHKTASIRDPVSTKRAMGLDPHDGSWCDPTIGKLYSSLE